MGERGSQPVNKHPDKTMSCAPCSSISQKIIYFRQISNNQESVQICFIALSHRYITVVFADKKGKISPGGDHTVNQISYKKTRGMSDSINESLFL